MAAKKKNKPRYLGLTDPETAAIDIVLKIEKKKLNVTTQAVATLWGNKDRTYVWRVLTSLIEKGWIERYGGRYYKSSYDI